MQLLALPAGTVLAGGRPPLKKTKYLPARSVGAMLTGQPPQKIKYLRARPVGAMLTGPPPPQLNICRSRRRQNSMTQFFVGSRVEHYATGRAARVLAVGTGRREGYVFLIFEEVHWTTGLLCMDWRRMAAFRHVPPPPPARPPPTPPLAALMDAPFMLALMDA